MPRRFRAPSVLLAATLMSGCSLQGIPGAAGLDVLPTGAGGVQGKVGRPFAEGALGTGGDAAPAAKPTNTGSGSGSGSGSGANVVPSSPTTGKPKPDAGAIGLSTFFDTYNFNFPVPAGQALGAVANVSQAAIGPAGGRVYLQIGLQTTDKLPAARRPLNVSFVFDKSGSMSGEKIEYSRIAAKKMIGQLGEQDLFSLVTFDTNVATLLAPAFAVDKEAMQARVDGIREGSSTNIDGGLSEGYKHVRTNYDQGKVNRVILMSDGEANVGITDAESLGERAAGFASRDISLTTIGVGLGFQEAFMTHLATRGNGTFYFVNSAEDAQTAFVGEIQQLQRIVARSVKLNIKLAEGVTLKQVFGHTSETAGQSLNVDSNDLIAQQSKVLLLELEVPAGAEGAEQALADVTVDFDDVTFGGTKQAKAAAKVRYTADVAAQDASRDSKVASSVINLQAASAMLAAAAKLDDRDVDGATTTLNAQHQLVLAKAEELKDADLRDLAASLKRYLDRLGADDAEVLKKELQFEAFQIQQGKKKATTGRL